MSLKVFDLQCDFGHVFEGWFGANDSFESQQERGILSCPVCESPVIIKKLSAPRLNMGRAQPTDPTTPSGEAAAPSGSASQAATNRLAELQAQFMTHVREIVRNTENVGEQFAQEVRRMHEGEIEERAIRGTASPEEREALLEEGINVGVIPEFLDDDRLQ